MARVSIRGFLESRTTSERACATSLEPLEATSTRSFWDSLIRMSAIVDEEAVLGMLCMKCEQREGVWSTMLYDVLDFGEGLFRQEEAVEGLE